MYFLCSSRTAPSEARLLVVSTCPGASTRRLHEAREDHFGLCVCIDTLRTHRTAAQIERIFQLALRLRKETKVLVSVTNGLADGSFHEGPRAEFAADSCGRAIQRRAHLEIRIRPGVGPSLSARSRHGQHVVLQEFIN